MTSKSKLSDHILKKGKFISPFNNALGDKIKLRSWFHEALPEYLWVALIFNKYERKEGLNTVSTILKKLISIEKDIHLPMFSKILRMEKKNLEEFFSFILSITDEDVFSPLTLIYNYSDFPIFSKYFCVPEIPLKNRQETLNKILNMGADHQSNFSTDIRFLVLYYSLISGKLKVPKEFIKDYDDYYKLEHSDDRMHSVRPSIRAAEIGLNFDNRYTDYKFLEYFWEKVSVMSDCDLSGFNYKENEIDSKGYIDVLFEVFKYLSDLFLATNPIDKRMTVIIGISTYSYKRIAEIVDHKLFNSITGRSTVRVLIENYIMMKYLLKNEQEKPDIWELFQSYGIGHFKIIVTKHRDIGKDLPQSHVEYKYIDAIVNEYINEDFMDMDTSYFGKDNIREKARLVGEKELYGLYYDYDSSYEHGLWGAIRESSLIKCVSPAHQYHCVPDYERVQNLKNVWPDCVMIMNKMINLLDREFGIPTNIMERLKNFEK